ncbi:hypothetical protein [Leminorella grimontii]|uniref:toxin-antitoxin system YwqK family antitoxin n=1 Tax=Leminorella grimontii TaxID=82981 RepID=UPI00321F92D4
MLKNCLLILFSLLALSGCTKTANVPTDIPLDQEATKAAPWKPGEIVAQGNGLIYYDIAGSKSVSRSYPIYRAFVGVLPNGHYMVQEFYSDSDRKFTDPYELSESADVNVISPIRDSQSIKGTITTWYPNGKKYGEDVRGEERGSFQSWYINGKPWMKGSLYKDLPYGHTTYWYPNGQKSHEGEQHYSEDVGEWKYWDMQGRELTKREFRHYQETEYQLLSPDDYLK